jgi:hypothetical protein
MADTSETFFLRSKGVTLGMVVFERHDWPWNFGRFAPSPEFSSYEPAFIAALSAHRADNEQQRGDAIRKITHMELELVRCDTGDLAGEPDLLWIDGHRINWRGSRGVLRQL